MRFIFAGLLLLLIPTMAFAQATGQVVGIGLGQGYYRPNCWTPMLVQLNPTTNDSGNYEIEVWQHDLDGDRPIYTRPIVLNGADQAPQQKFWMYFLPQPIDHGLPSGPGTTNELQKDLQVFLCQPNHKQIVKLPLTTPLQNIDPLVPANGVVWGSKLILAVSTSGTKVPTLNPLSGANSGALGSGRTIAGFKEDIAVIKIHSSELPEDPIGYEAVDAIVWLDGNPNDLSAGNLDTLNALKAYVRNGGQLIICQSTSNWKEDTNFGDMLPVDLQGVDNKSNFDPLMSMAAPQGERDPIISDPKETWANTHGPYQMVRATTRPDAMVDQWIDWKQDGSYSDTTPWLARKAYGLGQVTWVAQPLSTDQAPINTTAWPYIWDKVLGYKSNTYAVPEKVRVDDERIATRMAIYEPGAPTDLGFTLVQGLNLNSRANWLILLAIVFFFGYWLIAGPGSYLFLASKGKKHWSWFAFGVSALVAALITFAVVKLVLRGPPEIRHLTFVRIAPNQPAVVDTRFGLYIPRDGAQKIALDDTAPNAVSYISPFAEHPQQLGDATEFPSPTEYFVPVRDLKSDSQPLLTVDYRSSLKKFQAHWEGKLDAHFTADVKLEKDEGKFHLSGTLTNASGVDLSDVYLAFRVSNDLDWMIYVPDWGKGVTYDIRRDFLDHQFLLGRTSQQVQAVPGERKIISDQITGPHANGWLNYWYDEYHRGGSDDPNVVKDNLNYIYPMLCLFDRIPAMPNTVKKARYTGETDQVSKERSEFLNRGARMLNASSAIADGQLVIFATAKGGLPIPLEVDDEKMTGDGTIFYQFILPMDRSGADAPTTQPAK